MSQCAVIKPLIPAHAGKDLDDVRARQVQAHLGDCVECRAELSQFAHLIQATRQALPSQHRLSSAVRAAVASEAAARTARWDWGFLSFQAMAHRGLIGAAASVLLVAGLAFIGLHPQGRGAGSRRTEVSKIDVVANGGIVRLAWSDGVRESYTVHKSADPRTVERGEAHVVKGNVWIDSTPDSSPVVFYRID